MINFLIDLVPWVGYLAVYLAVGFGYAKAWAKIAGVEEGEWKNEWTCSGKGLFVPTLYPERDYYHSYTKGMPVDWVMRWSVYGWPMAALMSVVIFVYIRVLKKGGMKIDKWITSFLTPTPKQIEPKDESKEMKEAEAEVNQIAPGNEQNEN